MEKLSSFKNSTWEWIQTRAFLNLFELRSGRQLAGSFLWIHSKKRPRRNLISSGITADGNWIFETTYYIHPRVTVRSSSSNQIDAVFVATLSGSGILTCASGSSYAWRNMDPFGNHFGFSERGKEEILVFSPGLSTLQKGAKMFIDGQIESTPELSLLALLGFYLLLESNFRSKQTPLPISIQNVS